MQSQSRLLRNSNKFTHSLLRSGACHEEALTSAKKADFDAISALASEPDPPKSSQGGGREDMSMRSSVRMSKLKIVRPMEEK